MTIKALSIKQPWAHAIMSLGKDIENRDWLAKFRGTIAVHASKTMTGGDLRAFNLFASEIVETVKLREIMRLIDEKQIPFGAFLGTVEITDCVEESDSEWFCGKYGFVLENPRLLAEPVPCKGALGFWEVPQELFRQFVFADGNSSPINLVLHCPECGTRHIDEAEPSACQECGANKSNHNGKDNGTCPEFTAWTNPPHKSHRCKKCNHVWRPYDFATNGV